MSIANEPSREPLHIILSNASTTHRRICRQEFARLNLSEGQPKVLANLLDQEGIVQKELATICSVEPATMTSLLQKLQQDGLIEKRAASVSGGKRAFCIYLTNQGRTLAESVRQIMTDAEKRAFQGFTEEEKAQFLSLITRLTNNLC